MNKNRYPPHGKLHLSVEGQLLIIRGAGPANLEMVQEYQSQVISFREQIMDAPWASLVLLSETPLVPPEGKDILIQTIKQAKTMHLCATAVVFVDVEFADMVKHFWLDIYHDTGVTYQFFETEEQARSWLQDKLAESPSKTVVP